MKAVSIDIIPGLYLSLIFSVFILALFQRITPRAVRKWGQVKMNQLGPIEHLEKLQSKALCPDPKQFHLIQWG